METVNQIASVGILVLRLRISFLVRVQFLLQHYGREREKQREGKRDREREREQSQREKASLEPLEGRGPTLSFYPALDHTPWLPSRHRSTPFAPAVHSCPQALESG